MNTQEIANKLVEYCRTGQFEKCYQELYSEKCWSVEPEGSSFEPAKGMEAMKKKGEQWQSMVKEMHSATVSDPIVAADSFACVMENDVTFADGNRRQISEVCVYDVWEGKIVKESFFYPVG